MVAKGLFNPQTGADSVPFPETETAEQAIVRCRGQAGEFDVEQRFDRTIAMLVETFDERLANPIYAGLSLDESGFFAEYLIDDLQKSWKAMSAAFDAADRDAYRKAAAEFCKAAAILSCGVIAPSDEEVAHD
jgi:hypothetical protein